MTTATLDTYFKTTLLRHLRKGRANAIRKADLARLCGCNEREMRRTITEELVRQDKVLIGLSTRKPYGYFLIETPEELDDCCATLRSYCVSAAVHRRDLLRAAKSRLFGQRSLL